MMTTAVYVIAAIGLAAWVVARRRAREARLNFRFARAPRTVSNTVKFLCDERRAATRGVLPSLVAAILLCGLYVVSAWPQAAILHGHRQLIGVSAEVAAATAFLTLYRGRKSFVNAAFLKRYINQGASHYGFRPHTVRDAKRLMAQLRKPAVSKASDNGFRAGGFDWTLDDFWKNCAVFGQPGSGKTVALLNTFLEGMLATSKKSKLPASGAILDPKGEFRGPIQTLARRYKRERDLVIFNPASWAEHGRTARSIAYNPLDCADDGLEIAARIVAAGRLAGGIVSNDTFFIDSARTFLRHSVEFIRAGKPNDPPSFLDLRRLATDPTGDEADDSFYLELSRAILSRHADAASTPTAVIDAISYFEGEWRRMPDRQRGGVIGSITQIIDEFSVEPFRSMMSGRSTITIANIIDSGKILYVDLPIAERPRMAMLVNGLIKLEFQREILRRVGKERPSFFFCDEFPVVWSSSGNGGGDADFFALSRASRHANIIAAQNISAFYKKADNKDEARNFLGNTATKLFLRNTETETNDWASRLFGERSEITIGAHESASFDDSARRNLTNFGRSLSMARNVPPEAFSELAIPLRGCRDQQYAECIAHLASRATTQKLDLVWRVNPL